MAKRHLAGKLLQDSASTLRPNSRMGEHEAGGWRSSSRMGDVEARAASPTGTRRSQPAWHDVLDLCKKGFSMKMDVMGEEVLQQVRHEVQGVLKGMVKEVHESMERREEGINRKLAEMCGKLEQIYDTAEKGRDRISRLDLSPITEEIQASESTLSAAGRKLEDRCTQISEQLQRMQSHAELEQERGQQISQRLQLAEGHLQKLVDSLPVQAETLAQDVQRMSRQIMDEQQVMEVKLEKISTQTCMLPGKADVRGVSDQVRRTENVLNVDFQLILTEVSKVQKALQIEFVEATEFGVGLHDHVETAARHFNDHDGESPAIEDISPSPPDEEELPELEGAQSIKDKAMRTLLVKHEEILLKAAFQNWFKAMSMPAQIPNPWSRRSTVKAAGMGLKVKKRVREFWAQTDNPTHADSNTQTDPRMTEKKKEKPKAKPKPKKEEPPPKDKPVFADAEAMKAKARMALVKPQYNVMDYYRDKGWSQMIARNPKFENVTLFVVCINAVWMAIDTDWNDKALLQDMDPVFIVAEMSFCFFFTAEVMIRFAAFAYKSSAFRDIWFVFDAFLVLLMVLETWILPMFVLLSPTLANILNSLDLGTLRLVRMVKIIRLTRMAKLLRLFPELKIIIKGIRFASRSVGVFFLLWMMLIFVVAIVVTQLNSSFKTTNEFNNLFGRVSISMETLLLNGILPQQAAMLRTAMSASPVFWLMLLAFVLMASVTIMYMLVGVLVEVMSAISVSEKEGMTVSFVATQLRETMESLNYNTLESLSQSEFEQLLMLPEPARIVSGVGVDIGVLLDMMDIIYEDLDKKGIVGLTFESMVDLILNLRGANTATVKDVKEILRVMKAMIKDNLLVLQKRIQDEFYNIRSDLGALREETMQKHEDEMYGDEEDGY